MAKKVIKSSPVKKVSNIDLTVFPIINGHRDLAEILSIDYGFIVEKTGWEPMKELFNMDVLTSYLEDIDGQILNLTMNDRWAQGFLMGMLHQTIVTQDIIDELDGDDDL